MNTPTPEQHRTRGAAFMAIGAAFIAIGMQQPAFIGVAAAFFALGAAMLGKSHKGDGP